MCSKYFDFPMSFELDFHSILDSLVHYKPSRGEFFQTFYHIDSDQHTLKKLRIKNTVFSFSRHVHELLKVKISIANKIVINNVLIPKLDFHKLITGGRYFENVRPSWILTTIFMCSRFVFLSSNCYFYVRILTNKTRVNTIFENVSKSFSKKAWTGLTVNDILCDFV